MTTELNQHLSDKVSTKIEHCNLQKKRSLLDDCCTGLHCTAVVFMVNMICGRTCNKESHSIFHNIYFTLYIYIYICSFIRFIPTDKPHQNNNERKISSDWLWWSYICLYSLCVCVTLYVSVCAFVCEKVNKCSLDAVEYTYESHCIGKYTYLRFVLEYMQFPLPVCVHCMHACVTAYNLLCCQICAVPFHPSHLFNMRHSPQNHGTLLSYVLWVSVTQHCMACLLFLTSTPLSTLQSSSIFRQPLDLDFICKSKKKERRKEREASWLQSGALSEHTGIKDACILQWSLMSRMWGVHMIRSCYAEAWIRFRLASNYRDQKKAFCSL